MPLIGKPARVGRPTANIRQRIQAAAEAELDYRYANTTKLPIKGLKSPLVSEDDYYRRTEQAAKACYGCFDVSKPRQRKFRRTLSDVLARSASGEFAVVSMTEYNNGVVGEDPSRPPGLFVFVIWYEKYDVDTLSETPEG